MDQRTLEYYWKKHKEHKEELHIMHEARRRMEQQLKDANEKLAATQERLDEVIEDRDRCLFDLSKVFAYLDKQSNHMSAAIRKLLGLQTKMEDRLRLRVLIGRGGDYTLDGYLFTGLTHRTPEEHAADWFECGPGAEANEEKYLIEFVKVRYDSTLGTAIVVSVENRMGVLQFLDYVRNKSIDFQI